MHTHTHAHTTHTCTHKCVTCELILFKKILSLTFETMTMHLTETAFYSWVPKKSIMALGSCLLDRPRSQVTHEPLQQIVGGHYGEQPLRFGD